MGILKTQINPNYIGLTSSYVLAAQDTLANCTANTFNVTLLTAVGISGYVFTIKNSGTGVVTILTTSSQTIDGQASGTITLNQYDSLSVASNGSNWMII